MMKKRKANSFLCLDIFKKILPKHKNSQTTIFIILAVLILGAIAGTSYLQQSKKTEFLSLKENKDKIDRARNLALVCIENSVSTSLDKIGFQGGYFEKPKYYYKDEFTENFLTYYYHQGEISYPSKAVVEKELSKAINEELGLCNELKSEEDNFELKFGKPRTITKINEKDISFDIIYPVIISINGESTTIFRDHKINRISALNNILETASFMTESRKESPETDCISCLAKMTEEKNLYMEVYNFDEDTTIVGIYENYTQDQQSLIFLNKF